MAARFFRMSLVKLFVFSCFRAFVILFNPGRENRPGRKYARSGSQNFCPAPLVTFRN